MYNLHLSAEQREFRDTLHDFVEREIKPPALKAARLDACDHTPPPGTLEATCALGLRGLMLSEAAGGAGADTLTACLVAEELAAGDADIAAIVCRTMYLAPLVFDGLMNDEQRGRFLPAFTRDEAFHLALADLEPDADREIGPHYHEGTPAVQALATTAMRRSDGDWEIDGVKRTVGNGPIAGLLVVTARAPEGNRRFLVQATTPGIVHRPAPTHTRWFHGTCADIAFSGCRVPAINLLETAADRAAVEDPGRDDVIRAAMNLGVGRAAADAALEYAKVRVQGARRIVEHQSIGTLLAQIAIKVDTARAMVWRAAWACDHPQAIADRSLPADLPIPSMTRVLVSELMHKVTLDAAEVFGAMGVMRDMPLQRYVEDAHIFLHGEQSNHDAKLRIAEALAGFRRTSPGAA